MILAVWAVRCERPTLAGVILGLATAIKFQVALPFIVFYLLVRRWRVGAVALWILAAISVIGIVPLELHHIPWFTEWTSNAGRRRCCPAAKRSDPAAVPTQPDQRAELALCHLRQRQYGETLARCFAVPRGVSRPAAIKTRAGIISPGSSCVALLSFLPVYRRCTTRRLALLLTWAIAALRTPLRNAALVTLLLLSELWVPPSRSCRCFLRHVAWVERIAKRGFGNC